MTASFARTTLVSCLAAAQSLNAEYRGGLSNHLPMALIALARIGADDATLTAFAAAYAARLEPSRELALGPADEARPPLGVIGAYPAWRRYFARELQHLPRAQVLEAALPWLSAGVGAAAFHGLIRTAYGLALEHDDEVEAGLAYWAARYLPLEHNIRAGDKTVALWCADLIGGIATVTHSDSLIFMRMQEIAAQPAFGLAIDGLRLDATTLEALATHAASEYLLSRDFTVLHLVTSAHALRVVMEHCQAPSRLLNDYGVAYAAALVSSATTARTPRSDVTLPWLRICAIAASSGNDHVIKLVDSCLQQQMRYGGALWQRVAAAAVA